MATNPIKLDGAWNVGNAAELHERFTGLLTLGEDLVLDLAEVQECDTAALQLLASLCQTAVARGQSFRIADRSPAVEAAAVELGISLQALSQSPGGTQGGI